MKSPWKMIGQLISWRKSPEEGQRPAKHSGNSPAKDEVAGGAAEPSPTSQQTEIEPQSNDTEAAEELGSNTREAATEVAVVSVETADAPPANKRERTRSGKRSKAAGSAIAPTTQGAPSKRAGWNKNARVQPTTRKANTAIRATLPRSAHEMFQAEVADVDREIGELSHQLAQKLRQQNAQLREMLARFGED